MSLGQIIDYFRNELRTKLLRPYCAKTLTLWDHYCWIKSNDIYQHYLLNNNDFLQFWFRICNELCCCNDIRALTLKNALDKYFYFLLDFETYFHTFISSKVFPSTKKIMQAVVDYNLNRNKLRTKVKRNKKTRELFLEFVNKVNEWNYWKKVIIEQFVRINIGEEAYKQVKEDYNSLKQFIELLKNTDQLWDKGIQGNNT